MSATFSVRLTSDFLKPDGTPAFGDIGLGILDGAHGVTWGFLTGGAGEIDREEVQDCDALLVLSPRVTADTVEGADRLAIVARFGVGYDNVDLDACTRNGVLVTITRDSVRRPMATAALALLLALSHGLVVKDRLTRAGRWVDRSDHMGVGLVGRTLGLVGLGGIGKEVLALARPLQMRHLAADPFVTPRDAAEVGAELVGLEDLLAASDFVCITCSLTPETYHLIDAERLALMRPSAFVINVARGPIVDQVALTAALRAGRLHGAGLDVFEQEPVDPNDPILALENVIVAPHALGWSDQGFLANGLSACRGILEVAAGRIPEHVVNRAVLENPRLHEKLRRFSTQR